ncbi:post-PEP-CTERM-1 domain-containing protein [Massilia sp. CMS3.1]|uniref:post-PEP-CTERM-1 domain-containing protein n=1 Tax=Massilia sp. CMS3.1 TaxID=3373083 RepID=UPI003EE62936
MSYKKTLAILPCAVLCAGLSSSALAQEQSGETQSGMIVVRDAQTGQLRAPTAAESRALAPPPSASMRAQSQAQPALVTYPSGSRQVRLGERGLVYSVVTRGADGKLAEQCVHGAAAAEKAVHAPASTQHNEEHHHD